jgi:hypothetical protein
MVETTHGPSGNNVSRREAHQMSSFLLAWGGRY